MISRMLPVLALLLCGTAHGQVAANDPPGREHSIPLFMAHGNPEQRQGFIRIINHSDEAGVVEILGIDDAGTRYGPVELEIGVRETKHLNSEDLENGNGDKGLPDGLGDGEGDWRLLIYGGELDVEPLAYIRTLGDGFLTSMHDVVPDASLRHRVPIFNPGKNVQQESSLRLINPGDTEAAVVITGRDSAPEDDEDAAESSGEFRLSIPAGGARTVKSSEIQDGDADSTGIGEGTGKWSLDVRSDVPIGVVNLMSTPTGHLTNLSSANPDYRGAAGLWQISFEDGEGGDGYLILLPDSRVYAWLPEANEVNRIARGTFETTAEGIEGAGELFESGVVEVQGLTPVGGKEDFTLTASYRSGDWIRGEYRTAAGIDRSFRGWAFTGFERGGALASIVGLWQPVLGEDADLSESFEPTDEGELDFMFQAGTFTCEVEGKIGPVNPAYNVYEADVTIQCSLLVLLPTVVDLVLAVYDSPEGPGSGDRVVVLAIVHNQSKIGFGSLFRRDDSL